MNTLLVLSNGNCPVWIIKGSLMNVPMPKLRDNWNELPAFHLSNARLTHPMAPAMNRVDTLKWESLYATSRCGIIVPGAIGSTACQGYINEEG